MALQLNLEKAMFMRNGRVSDAPFMPNGGNISKCQGLVQVYISGEVDVANDLAPEPGRRRRAI